MQRLAFYLIVALVTFLIGVAITISLFFFRFYYSKQTLKPEPQVISSEQPINTQTEIHPKELIIPDLSKARLSSFTNDEKTNIAIERFTHISSNSDFSRCENLENVRRWNGADPTTLAVHQITRFSVNDQAWLYKMDAHPPQLLVTFSFDFVDEDGNGKFDRCAALLDSSKIAFKMPDWARKKIRTISKSAKRQK